jgi:hypothetical protein
MTRRCKRLALAVALARVRNNGWSLAGLAETYRRKGDVAGERATRAALAKAWLGPAGAPPIERLRSTPGSSRKRRMRPQCAHRW